MWIHQIWFDLSRGRGPECSDQQQQRAARAWQEHNRTHTYHVWSLPEAVRVCDREYPDVAAVLLDDTLAEPIVKCDLFRYVLMHKFGGVYADHDFVPLVDVDEIVRRLRALDATVDVAGCEDSAGTASPAHAQVFLFEEWPHSSREHPSPKDGTVHNGLLVSVQPKQRVFRAAIDESMRRLRSRGVFSKHDVFWCTGTKLLRDVAVNDPDVCILRDYVACPTLCVLTDSKGVATKFAVVDPATSETAFQALEKKRGLPNSLPDDVKDTALHLPGFDSPETLCALFPTSIAVLCASESHWR